MGHGIRLYCAHGFSELGKIRGAGGLDKIWVVAPEMVQCPGCAGRSGRDPWNPTLAHGTRWVGVPADHDQVGKVTKNPMYTNVRIAIAVITNQIRRPHAPASADITIDNTIVRPPAE
jgi:hypothetical protein